VIFDHVIKEAELCVYKALSAWGKGHGAKRKEHSKKDNLKKMVKFRFQDLEVWQLAIEIADELFDIADDLEKRKLYRFAEQLRGAGMSISNNIAEGSGSNSAKDFANFLNIAKRSTFENANIIILLKRRNLITLEKESELLEKLDKLSRKIANLRKSLK